MLKGLSLLLLTGCLSNNSLDTMSAAKENVWNLSEICVGMNEKEVFRVMRHPHSKKTVTHDGVVYNIWFYITKQTGLSQSRLVRQNLTPLTFENGILKGWGFEYYHQVLAKLQPSASSEKSQGSPEQKSNPPRLQKTIENLQTPSSAPESSPQGAKKKGESAPAKQEPQPEAPPKGKPQKTPSLQQSMEEVKPAHPEPGKTEPKAPPKPQIIESSSKATSANEKTSTPPKKKTKPQEKNGQEQKEEKRDDAIRDDNNQNFDFW